MKAPEAGGTGRTLPFATPARNKDQIPDETGEMSMDEDEDWEQDLAVEEVPQFRAPAAVEMLAAGRTWAGEPPSSVPKMKTPQQVIELKDPVLVFTILSIRLSIFLYKQY